MDAILGILVLVLLILFIQQRRKLNKTQKKEQPEKEEKEPLPISGAYKKRWMFTYNEKDAYQKLKEIAEKEGYIVFAKVRLLDLVEPESGNPKYKTYFNKVKAKHVDFVLCDKKLIAKVIIELDDSSHDAVDRKARDAFVDEVLQSVGYKVIHTRAITESIREQIR